MTKYPIKILITGDFCPINRVEQLALDHDFGAIFNDFTEILKDNDLSITDLECPLTSSEDVRPKTGPHQKAHPDCIKILEYAGINLACMSNNHIMDYNVAGVAETLELCKSHGIETVGIGRSSSECATPFTKTVRNKRIAVLNYADNEFISTPDGSYTCNPIDTVRCYYDIKDARKENEFLIVVIHAGNEFYELPSPRLKNIFRYLIDLGADAIISHHTHAFSGYEIYNTKPIFYGLGNFLYDWPGKNNGKWNTGYAVRLLISDRVDFELIPLKQSNEKPGVFLLNKEEKEEFKLEIARLNSIISNDLLLEAEFQKYCLSVFPMYDSFIEPYFGKKIASLRKRGFFPKLLSRRKRLLLLNLTRCESHRDVLLRMLARYE